MWRHGNPRRPGLGAGHHQEEESLASDGSHSDLVSVQDEGVRRGPYQGKLESFSLKICFSFTPHHPQDFTQSWANGLAFCALIHNFFPQSFDFKSLKTETAADRRRNFDLAFTTGEKFAGVPDFLTAEDMSGMVEESRVDPKMIFSYVQEVYRMCNEL